MTDTKVNSNPAQSFHVNIFIGITYRPYVHHGGKHCNCGHSEVTRSVIPVSQSRETLIFVLCYRSLSLSIETIFKYRRGKKIKTILIIEIIDPHRGSKTREIYAIIWKVSMAAMTVTSYHMISTEGPTEIKCTALRTCKHALNPWLCSSSRNSFNRLTKVKMAVEREHYGTLGLQGVGKCSPSQSHPQAGCLYLSLQFLQILRDLFDLPAAGKGTG